MFTNLGKDCFLILLLCWQKTHSKITKWKRHSVIEMFAFPTRVTDDFLYSMLALTRLLCSIHQSANITDARSWHQLWELAGTRTNPTRSGLWWSGSTWWWDCGIFSWWLKKLQLQKHQQTPFLLSIWRTCCRMSLQNCKLYDQVWELPIFWNIESLEEYKNTNSTNQKIPELLDTESNQPGCKCTKTTNILLFRLEVYFIFWGLQLWGMTMSMLNRNPSVN